MATTSLGFNITSKYDGKGLAAARSDLTAFATQLNKLASKTIRINANLNVDSAKAKADLDAIAARQLKIDADLYVHDAKARAQVAAWEAKKVEVEIGVRLDEAQAKAKLHTMANSIKKMDLDLKLDTAVAEAKMAKLASQTRLMTIRADVDALAAEVELERLKSEYNVIDMYADLNVEMAEAKLRNVQLRNQRVQLGMDLDTKIADAKIALLEAKTRKVEMRVDADTSVAAARIQALQRNRFVRLFVNVDQANAVAHLAKITHFARYAALGVAGITAAFFLMGQAVVMVAALIQTALIGGLIAAGIAAAVMGKKMTDEHTKATQAAQRQAASAERGLSSAYRNAASTAQQGLRQIASAEKTLEQARKASVTTAAQGQKSVQKAYKDLESATKQAAQTAASGARSVVTAENRHRDAVTQAIRVRAKLNDAYKDSQRELDNLKMRLQGAAGDEKGAVIAVQRAMEAMHNLGKDGEPVTLLDREEAQNNIDQALQNLDEIRLGNQQLREDVAEADAKGVEGSDKVVAAKEAIRDADREVAESEQAVSQARQDAADANVAALERVAEAQTGIAEAQQAAAEANAAAADRIIEAEQGVAEAKQQAAEANAQAAEQIIAAQEAVTAAQTELNEAYNKQNGALAQTMRWFQTITQPMQGALRAAMEQLKQKAIELTPALQGMFAQVSPLVKPFAEGLSGLAERAIPGVTDSLRQSMPMMNGFRDGMGTLGAKTGEMFRGFGQGSEGLGQTWRVVGGQFGTFLASIGGFVGKFSSESATSLDKTLQGVNNLTSGMLNGLGPALQAMAGGNSIWFSLFTAIGSFFEKIGPSLGAFTEALGGALGPTIEKLGGSLGILVAAGLQGMSVMLPVVTPLIVGAAQAILSFVQFLEGLGPVLPIVMGVIMGMRLLSLATTVLAGSKMVVTAATVAWKIAMIAVRAVIFVVRAAAFALHLTYLLLTSSAMAQTVATKAVAAATIIGANAMKVLRIAMFALSSHPLVALFVALGAVIMILVARAGGLSGIWEKIKAGWNGLVNFFQPTIDFFKTLIGGIIHWFQHLWDVLLGHSIIPDIVNGAKKWFGMIWDIVGIIVRIVGAVIAKWVEFFTFMVKIFKLYLDVVFAVWGWIWDNILSKVVAVIGWVLGKIGDFFPLIVAAFNLYKDIVFAVWSWLWDNIFSKVFDVLGWIKNKWDEWWPVFKLSFEILRDTVMDIWNWLWDNVLTKIGDALGWVKDRFDLWWEAFKFGFELLRDTLMGIWNWLWDNILTKIGDAIGKAQEKFTAFKDKFGEILENLRSKAEEVWNKIKETFARPINVIIGFINDKILDNIGMGDKKIPKIEGYADGGTIPGAGHGRADDRLARVSSGEYIVNARAAEVNRPLLDQINYRGFIPKFADGGPVEWMSNWVRGVEPSMTMTSGLRFTDNGYHSRGMAADFSNGTATTPEMQNLAKRINETWGAQTLELIHTGPYNIKDGANVGDGMGVYGAATMAGHDNHVHWAVPGPLDDSQSGPSLLGKVGNFLGGVFNKGRELMSALFQRLSQPVLDGIPDPFTPGMGDKMGRAPKGLATMVRDRMAEMIRGKENTGGMLGGDIGGLVPDGERLKIIEEAMRITGTPPPDGAEDWVRGMNTLITRESGWNAGIINNWDSNAAAGMPSQGLAQVIPPTFNAHKVPGHDNILDPVSNVAASINYIKSQYGSIKNVQQANANMPPKGYKDGTENATPGWAMVGEEGPEMVKFRGGEEVVPLQDFTSKLSSAAESTGLRTKAETALTDAGKSMFDTFFQDLTGGGYESGFLGQLVKQGIDYGGKVASQSVTNNWNVVDVDEAMRKYKQQQKEQAIGYDY